MTLTRTVLTKSGWAPRLALLSLLAVSVSGCGSSGGPDAGSTGPASDDGGAARPAATVARTEVGALTPRIVLAHDGGVTVLDSASGAVVGRETIPGYVRLSPAGDGRHVILAAGDSFRVLDTGLIEKAHGDHSHFFTQTPALLDGAITAEHPGHVVPHGDRTALFADGTGTATLIDPALLQDGDVRTLGTVRTAAPHHGVAVPLTGGGLLQTEGTEESRSSVVVQDAAGRELARTDECPGVHGEAVAQPTEQGDVVALGCQDGPVVYRDGAFHKVAPLPGAERSGTLKGSETSPVVLADAEPATDHGTSRGSTTIGLLNTRDDTMRSVDLGSPSWFRSLDRGPNGEVLVLTGDGELNILDPENGAILHTVKAVGAWTEPEEWQEAAPMLAVADGTAFVVDPQAKHLVMVDIASGAIYRELDLPVVPHEIQVTEGTGAHAPRAAGVR